MRTSYHIDWNADWGGRLPEMIPLVEHRAFLGSYLRLEVDLPAAPARRCSVSAVLA
jgi:hypothetical protein